MAAGEDADGLLFPHKNIYNRITKEKTKKHFDMIDGIPTRNEFKFKSTLLGKYLLHAPVYLNVAEV